MTANAQTLWGGSAPFYLRGVRDEYCGTMPHHSWTDVIPAEQLLQALRSSQRTDPGLVLHGLTIARRDATGRVELITIEGQQSHVVRGWDFKIIVGRKLGWNRLKSSRFEVTRSGSNFIFRGSGFGHGLGLCQEGAHVMAQRGANYEQILGKYFPGTKVSQGAYDRTAALPGRRTDGSLAMGRERTFSDLLWTNKTPSTYTSIEPLFPSRHSSNRTTLSSEHFRVSYPVTVPQRDAEGVLKTLETARANLRL